MRQVFRFILVLFVFGGLAAAPAWPEEMDQAGKAPLQQIGSPAPPQEQRDSSPQKGDEGMGGGMMDSSMMSMMSKQGDMMGKMLDTMRDMAQMLKSQAKDPDAKARADQMLTQIEQMKNQHQAMGMMSNRGSATK